MPLGENQKNEEAASLAATAGGDENVIEKGKPDLLGSSDPAFRGDATRWNPEDLLVASLSSCHMLWYLHLCVQAKIILLAYQDDAQGTMVEDAGGGGRFTQVMLRPVATLAAGGDAALATALHEEAHRLCYIANSVSFPVLIEPTVLVAG
jgi:organic hydroperoxide reductase OsmC/OhrA